MSYKHPNEKEGDKKASRRSKSQNKNKKGFTKSEIAVVTEKYSELHNLQAKNATYAEFPLSQKTLEGLAECGYEVPTAVQKNSLPFSLTGHDVVAAAKTGSGKTLAMIIPILECLWRNNWNAALGLGALIISPTRELALQTFTCLNDIGKAHNFSCALLIGGTDVKYERKRLNSVNIIICTPGRLLQHMDENVYLDCGCVQILALDEADRMLDMGFSQQINAIVDNLPRTRQTLLFSATQTSNVQDLTRVCTKDPFFVNPHQNSEYATPAGLSQFYVTMAEEEKINMLWSFIVTHKFHKSLIFVTNCRQARFLTESFCHMRPGVVLMGLWGSMNQKKRVEVFQKFENTQHAVMIATDVASRGLDFSDVDWVVQMDAPSTIEDYIHRVGRTARMDSTGNSILFLNEFQESQMTVLLKKYNIPIEQQKGNKKKIVDARPALRNVIVQFPELKEYAQRSIVAYIKSVHMMKNKKVFDVNSINVEALADSYGLLSAPKIRFLRKMEKSNKTEKNKDDSQKFKNEMNIELNSFKIDDKDDGFLSVKTKDVFNTENATEEPLEELPAKPKKTKVINRVEAAQKLLKKGIVASVRTVFDEEGGNKDEEVEAASDSVGLDLDEAKREIAERDKKDRLTSRELKRKKRLAQREKEDRAKQMEAEEEDEDSDHSVDLSWLPDPDKPKNLDDEEEEPQEPKVKRRYREVVETQEKFALDLLNPF